MLKKTLLLGLIIIYSCQISDKNKKEIKASLIKGKEIFKDKFNIQNVYLVDSLVLVKNISTKEGYLFSIFKNDDEHTPIHNFGKIGDGPNEFEESVYYTSQYTTDSDGIKLWVYEMNRNKFSQINLTKSIDTKSIVISQSIRLKPGLSFKELYFINDNNIVGNQDNLTLKMNRLKFYNPLNNSITKNVELLTKIDNPKKNDINYTQQNYNTLFLSTMRYNKKQNKLVSAMVSMDKIDVFNTNGTFIKSIDNIKTPIKDIEEYNRKAKIFNADLFLTDKYIYALYSGDSMSDYFEKSSPTRIKIYDWNYNLKHVLSTNESLNFITVDQENKTIIGVSILQEKTMKYHIKI
ncbi:hypothetical protein DS884_07425 [Tenacibaculum sp. E3R01]|uniref:hypothetical protein n=1 Tax=Tenacibaculum sp. E3R01 TaxID=2267227 RepID=UPI000DEA5466|nr:hypothetical protein [Tenacibaculum sp. E3R01]RBW59557.1 hypothetical protein DS884_07425 [Tenacibaculum sp. E3R01]